MHSKELQNEVIEYNKVNEIDKTFEKYNYIGKSTIRRWIDPALKERNAKRAAERFREKWNESEEFRQNKLESNKKMLEDPEFYAKRQQYYKEYAEINKEKDIEKKKRWYDNHKEDIKFYRSLGYLEYKELPKNDK